MTGRLIIAAVAGTVAALLIPRLARRWVPTQPDRPAWADRVLAGAGSAFAAYLLIWRLGPSQPAGTAVLAGWLTFAFAGVLLSWVDIAVLRLPTRIVATRDCCSRRCSPPPPWAAATRC
jgi:hypothetical protein